APRQDAALLAAGNGQFQTADHVPCLLGRDRQLRLPQDGVAHVLVIVREARRDGRNRSSTLGPGQLSVSLGRFSVPVQLVVYASARHGRLLRVTTVSDVWHLVG